MIKNLLLGIFFVFVLFLASSTNLNIFLPHQARAVDCSKDDQYECENFDKQDCFWYAGYYGQDEYQSCKPRLGQATTTCSNISNIPSCYANQICGTQYCTIPIQNNERPPITPISSNPNEACATYTDCPDGQFCISNVIGQKGSSSCVPAGVGGPGSICEDYITQGYPISGVCASGVCGSDLKCVGSGKSQFEQCTSHSDCPSGEFCISNVIGQRGSSSCVLVGVGAPGSICEDYTTQGYGVSKVCASGVCGSDLKCTGSNGPQNSGDSCTTEGLGNNPAGTFTCDTSANPCTGPNEVPYTGLYSSCSSGVCCKNTALYSSPPNNSGSSTTSPSPSTSTTPSSQTPDPQGQPCINHGGIKTITAGCGTVTNNAANITTFDANKASTGQFCSLSYIDTYACNDGYTGDYLVQTTPTNQCAEPPWCPVAAAKPSPSGTGGTGGSTTPPTSTTPGDCSSVTFPAPNNQTFTDGTMQAAYNQCDALAGCFVYDGGVNAYPQCLPTSLQGPACGGAYCMSGDVCQTDTPYKGEVSCAAPEGLGQNCGDGYGLANPNCDSSQNLICAKSHTCQYADSSGAPTATPGVSYQQGGVGTVCGAGGKQTSNCSGQLGCFPGMGNASIVNGSVQYYCVTSGQMWCPSTQTSMPSNGNCPNTATSGNGSSSNQPAVPTATSTPVSTNPTATSVPNPGPQTVCGNSNNQMQDNPPCSSGWQYVAEPTMTTAQHVSGCNDQYPYHFTCN